MSNWRNTARLLCEIVHILICSVPSCISCHRLMQKRNSAIVREMKFANDCTKCTFFAQNCDITRAKICSFFRKSFANENHTSTKSPFLENLNMFIKFLLVHKQFVLKNLLLLRLRLLILFF